jgi:uncharacterized membrane-anchored protein YitT (DUF2179 family)
MLAFQTKQTLDRGNMIKKDSKFSFLYKYAIITLGCVIFSLGVSLFLDANGLASGGVTGIAIIIHKLLTDAGITFLETGTIIIIINIPLLIIGTIYFGWQFLISTSYATILASLLMVLWKTILAKYIPLTDNLLIASVAGGALFGVGVGLIFRMGASTGGTDIPVKILRKKFRHLKTGSISMISDIIVVTASFFVFKSIDTLFYTIVSVVVFTPVFNFMLYGGNSARMVYIISRDDQAQKISQRILNELDCGATFIDAEGAYTKEDKRIILCVIKPFNYPKLKDLVYEEDQKAFMIVTSAKEIYGEGYRSQSDLEL